MASTLTRIGIKRVPIFYIEVEQLPSEENWEFVFVNAGNGVKQMAVF